MRISKPMITPTFKIASFFTFLKVAYGKHHSRTEKLYFINCRNIFSLFFFSFCNSTFSAKNFVLLNRIENLSFLVPTVHYFSTGRNSSFSYYVFLCLEYHVIVLCLCAHCTSCMFVCLFIISQNCFFFYYFYILNIVLYISIV